MRDVSDEARDAASGIFSSTFVTTDDGTSYFDMDTAQSLTEAFSTDRTNSINAAFDNNFMREGSFLTDAGVEQIKKYNEAVQRGEDALTGFRSSMSDIDPVAAHMINNSNGAQISTDYLTSSVRNGSVANRLYARSLAYSASNAQNASLRARAASSAFSVAATVARTTSTVFDTLGISIKGIAGSLAFTAAITIAMKGLELLASKIDDIIHKAEKLREKAEESANVFKETSEKLSEYENELSSVQEKIEALEGKGELSLTDEEELERLRAENSELERKVKYYEILAEQSRKQATDDAVAALDEYTDDVGTKGTASHARYSSDREKYIQDGAYDVVDDLSYKLEQYKEAEQELKNLESDYINAPESKRSSIKNDVDDQEDRVAELKESLLDYYNEVNTLYSGITRGDSAEGDAYIAKLSPVLEEIINYLYEAEDAAESADTAIADVGKDTINETINNINSAAKGFESLNEIYDDIRDGSTTEGALFDFTSLVDEDFTSTFSNYTTEYNNFIKTVANSPNDLTKCQSAFNDLVTAWINGSGALDNLDEANKNVAVQMLESMGVANATAVVESRLTQARLEEATAAALSLESSEARIEAFNNEIVAMGLTQAATEKLQVAFRNAEIAKTELMKSGVLARLKLTREELESFQSLTDVLNQYSGRFGTKNGVLTNAYALNKLYSKGTAENTLYSYGKYLDAINATITEVSGINTTISSYKPADTSSASSSSSSSDKTELPEAYQKALAELKHQREMDEIDSEEYYEKLEALRKKYLDGVNIDEYIDENRSLLEEIYNGYKEVVDDYISKREEWISDRDTYQDWGPDDDAEKEWLRIIDKINDAAAKGLLSEKQKAELLEDAYRSAYEARLDLMNEHKDALQDVIDLTLDLYKQENEDLKESLEDQRDIYKEIIDAKKEALELAEDELSYQESVEEKVKEISKLQNQYDVLSLDDSREAQAKRATISEEITDLQDELAQYQREHNVEATQTMLDEQYDKYEKRIDDELDTLDDALDDAYEMIRFSLKRIDNDSDGLYNDLIEWNRKYGSGIDSDVTNSWNVAIDAVKRYKETVDGLTSASDVYDYLNHETDDSFVQRGKNFGNSSDYNNSTGDGNIQEIADKVRANLSSGNKLRLVNKDWSSPSGTQVGDLVVTGGGIYLKTSSGGKKVAPLNTTTGTTTSYAEVKKIYEAICKSLSINGYSKGGVVPYTGLAMLHGSSSSAENGFSAAQSKKLYDLINTNTTGSLLSNILKKSADSIGSIAKTVSYSSNPTISVSVDSPINITGATEKISEELDRYGEKLANKITQQITSAFSIRGKSIKASFNSL